MIEYNDYHLSQQLISTIRPGISGYLKLREGRKYHCQHCNNAKKGVKKYLKL